MAKRHVSRFEAIAVLRLLRDHYTTLAGVQETEGRGPEAQVYRHKADALQHGIDVCEGKRPTPSGVKL